MSSHHFVRDGQEPALIIMTSGGLSWSHIEALLEWNPSILVLDTELDVALSWKIKIDTVLCTSSMPQDRKVKLADQSPIQEISPAAGEEPLKMAVDWLLQRGHTAINVLGSLEQHGTVITKVLSQGIKAAIVLYEGDHRWVPVGRDGYEKWSAKGSLFKWYSVETGLEALDYRGLELEEDLLMKDGESSLTLFRAVAEGRIHIRLNAPVYGWWGENLV